MITAFCGASFAMEEQPSDKERLNLLPSNIRRFILPDDQSVLPVQTQHPELFDLQSLDDGPEVVHYQLGPIEQPCYIIERAKHSAADLDHGGQLATQYQPTFDSLACARLPVP